MPIAKRTAKKPAPDIEQSARTKAMQAFLEALPGARAVPVMAPRGTSPLSVMFKIMGKMFAVLALRGEEFVVLKCDPHLAEMLRAQYEGVGHRTHLDPRHA